MQRKNGGKTSDIVPGRNAEVSVHEGHEYVATPPVAEQYAPPDRVCDPDTGEVYGLAQMISSYSVRAKVSGAVMQFQVRGSVGPASFVQAIKGVDPGAEFETELRKEFGQKGELKRGVLQMVTIEARGDKVTVVAIGLNAEGHQVRADAWLDKDKATELVATLNTDAGSMQSAQAGLDGKEPAVLSMMDKGMEFSWRESERDGKTQRRLVEFQTGGVRTT